MSTKKSVCSLPLFVDFYEINNPKNRLAKFNDLIDQSREVYIVSAWVTSSDILDKLINSSKKVTLIIGLNENGFVTEPKIFNNIKKNKNFDLYIPNPNFTEGIFHPKMYIFQLKNKKIKAFIGSMNFTNKGLGKNAELLIEFEKAERLINEFKKLQKFCHRPTNKDIELYTKRYKEAEEAKKMIKDVNDKFTIESRKLWNDIYPKTWEDYVKSLEKCSRLTEKEILEKKKNWKFKDFKLGYNDPWKNTIEEADKVVSGKNKNLTECMHILYGIGDYELFGAMAHFNLNNFIKDDIFRRDLLSILKSFRDENFSEKTPEEKVEIVLHYYDRLIDMKKGIGPSTATRFLALVRPDVAVSYNGKSEEYFCNLRSAKGERKGYEQALRFVYNQSWYNSPEPKEKYEKEIWQNRAALIDIIAYATGSSDKHQKSKSNASSITSD